MHVVLYMSRMESGADSIRCTMDARCMINGARCTMEQIILRDLLDYTVHAAVT